VVVVVENNLWGFSTPSDRQFRVKDLAERSIAYGIPGVIVDGTDACQVYDATRDACERARRGEGPTLIEAKMMRMRGHAMHDAAQYVPRPLFDYWLKRDPIERLRRYLMEQKQWLTAREHEKLMAEVDAYLTSERAQAEASPMPTPQEDAKRQGAYCKGDCHSVQPKYGEVKFGVKASR